MGWDAAKKIVLVETTANSQHEVLDASCAGWPPTTIAMPNIEKYTQ